MKNNNLTEKEQQANKITPDDIRMKDIPGYEGLYAATSCGKIWDYKNKKFLPQWSNGTPYLLVTLRKDGVKKNMRVHRLVAMTYLPNPDNLPQVEHKNQNPKDNYLNNLRWSDHIVNSCNRKGNIAVFDTETCEIYCSVSRTKKATKATRTRIMNEGKHYHDTKQAQRFIFMADMTEELMQEYLRIYFDKKYNNRKTA